MQQPSNVIKQAFGDVIAPDQVVSLLIGSNTITLDGFGGIPLDSPFWVPNINSYDPEQAGRARKQVMKVIRWISGSAIAATVLGLCILMYWAGTMAKPSEVVAAPTIAWSAKAVTGDGVIVTVGAGDLTVPVGAILPNGEILRDLDIRRQTYSTDSHITAVKR
ncbi:hypothetical protein [Polaromonas sp.]|uniref:hypothetical protein n=1 Tax=Polaromonas sp. TaxID=1869339 RepID=UPI00352A9811